MAARHGAILSRVTDSLHQLPQSSRYVATLGYLAQALRASHRASLNQNPYQHQCLVGDSGPAVGLAVDLGDCLEDESLLGAFMLREDSM